MPRERIQVTGVGKAEIVVLLPGKCVSKEGDPCTSIETRIIEALVAEGYLFLDYGEEHKYHRELCFVPKNIK